MRTRLTKQRRVWILVAISGSLTVLLLWLGVGQHLVAMANPLYSDLHHAYHARYLTPQAQETGVVDLRDVVVARIPLGTGFAASRAVMEKAGFDLSETSTLLEQEGGGKKISGRMHSKRFLSFLGFSIVLKFDEDRLSSVEARTVSDSL